MILERGNASCINSAVERGLPPLSTPYLNRLARGQRFILVDETPDNVSASYLKRKHTRRELAGNILYPPGHCKAHRLTRISTTSLREDDVIGDVYNTEYVGQNMDYAKRIAAGLWDEVRNMDIVFPFNGPGIIRDEPTMERINLAAAGDPDHTKHTKEILRMTTMRRYDVVRGRVDPAGHDGALFPIQGAEEQRIRNERLIELLDGVDVRTGTLQHIENGCCPGGTHETHRKLYTAILDVGLMMNHHHQLPSKHRVGSMTASNAAQVGGFMICDVLSNALLRGLEGMANADPAGYPNLKVNPNRLVCSTLVWIFLVWICGRRLTHAGRTTPSDFQF